MNDPMQFRRGDVILVSFPQVSDPAKLKDRPAVIIQNNLGNRHSENFIIAYISSQIPQKEYPFHCRVFKGSPEAQGTGLRKDSVVKTEIIFTVAKKRVIQRLGKFNKAAMRRIDNCLKISLDL